MLDIKHDTFWSLVFRDTTVIQEKNLPSFVYVSVFRAPCMINSSLKWQVFPAWNLFLEKPCKAKSLKNQNHLVPRPFFIRTSTLQVNLFQKLSFLNQLTHNMTRDSSLNSPQNTSSQHVVYKYCFECQNNVHNLFWICIFRGI